MCCFHYMAGVDKVEWIWREKEAFFFFTFIYISVDMAWASFATLEEDMCEFFEGGQFRNSIVWEEHYVELQIVKC